MITGPTTTQITNNSYDDNDTKINDNGWVTWVGFDGNDSEIFLYNGTTTAQITNNSYDDFGPQVNDSGWVTWYGSDGHDDEIFLAKNEIDNDSDGILLYNPEDARFFLKNDLSGGVADTKFYYGPSNAGWDVITGDWNGDGQTTVGLFNPDQSKFYLKNTHSGGAADIKFVFGPAFMNWIPVTGDWNGNGQCGIGLYDSADGTFRLKNINNSGVANEKISIRAFKCRMAAHIR